MKVSTMYLSKQNFQARPNQGATNTEINTGIKPQSNPQVDRSKALGLSLAAMAAISFAGVQQNAAFGLQQNQKPNPIKNIMDARALNPNKIDDGNLAVAFEPPSNIKMDYNSMLAPFKASVEKLQQLRKTDSHYSWIDLPSKLLNENYVGNVYSKINDFKKPFNKDTKLIFVALGNPANTDEIVNAMGLGKNFFPTCDITPAQVDDTIKKAGGNLENIQVIISSKSGSTFESNQNYKILDEKFTEYYTKKGLSPEAAKKEVSKHFLFITDKNPEKSKLKAKADKDGIITIDAVDGLHSAFGDLAYSMPVLAYMGLSEDSAKKMLKSADEVNKSLLSDDLNKNMAAKIAAFDKLAIDQGASKEQFIFHDSHFTNLSKTTEQLYKESLRKLDFTTSVYPRSAHSGLETDVSRGLEGQHLNLITNVSVKTPLDSQNKQDARYVISAKNLDKAHEMKLKQEGHFQKNLELNLGKDGITPESMGEFLQLKSYLVFFKNEFENAGKMDLYNQDYVKDYKKILTELEKPSN